MNDESKELYEAVKDRINVLKKEGTWESKFGWFWKFASSIKSKQHDLRYLYEDSSREFVEKYKDQLVAMREEFLENLDYYVEKCIRVMREVNNMTVYLAKTNEEAQDIFLKEIGDSKVIYKSKSNEAKDIGILDVLKKNNIEIKETDLGDVLVQLFDYKLPSFGVGPGAHFTKEEIVAKIKEVHGVELEPKASAIVEYYRENYRKELLNDVKVSLTSANVISAEDGTIILGENEGNISLLTRATEKHIVLCGITKIVPTILDAVLVAKIQTRINNVSFNYISLISGPSATADVQGEKVLGMYGAKEVVVILVDDWRTKAMKEELLYRDLIKCIGCRTCNYVCTASRAFGNIYASKYGLGADGIIRDYIHNGIEAAVKDGLFFCTGCENCYHWCPVSVNLGEIMKSLKIEATKAGLTPPPLKEYQQKILKEKNPFK
ncbi:MAG: lactate utilization protein [Candidatus Lokiarchaeota archaeon]|nr:lactate utilization protein [Candidatus Lokiarchaeota archaeon]